MRGRPALAASIAVAITLALACSRPPESTQRTIGFDGGAESIKTRSGWSGPERAPDGTRFCWAEGREAVLAIGGVVRQPHRVSLRVWSFEFPQAPPQRLTLFVNDTRVAEVTVSGAPAEHTLDTPWSVWSDQENVLRFRFSRADAPRDRLAGSGDARLLAAAFDWIRVVPLAN